jgi:hypothetical protein
METVYRMWDFQELLLDMKSPSPLMVEKSYCIPNRFPATPEVKEEDTRYLPLHLSPNPY